MILTRSTHLVQPLGPVELDTSNPLTRGVVVAWVPGSSRNIQDGKPASVNGVLSVGPYGYMQATTGTQKALLVPDAPSQRTPTFTSYAILRRASTLPSNFDGVGKNWQSNTATTYISDTIAYNPSNGGQNNIAAIFGRSGGNTQSPVYSGQDTSQWHSIASTHNGSTGSLYVGGALRSTVAVQPVVYGSSGDNSFGTNTSGKSGSMEYALVLRWNRALSASEIALLESNPWQLFRPIQRRIYFDVDSIAPPLDHILTAESAIQQILSEVGSVSQENTLVGGISVQSAVSSDGVIQQVNTLVGNAVNELSSATSGVIQQINLLQGSNSKEQNTSTSGSLLQNNLLASGSSKTSSVTSSGALQQSNLLTGLSSAINTISTAAGILQGHLLLGGVSLQPNYSSAGDIALVPTAILGGSSVHQTPISAAGGVVQNHKMVSAAIEQPTTSSNASVIQRHVLIVNNSTQIVLSSSGAIGTSGSLLGNNAQQTNTSSSGFIIQASFLQGNVVKQVNLSSSGAITQGGALPPLTDGELREILASMQSAIARLQVRLDAMY